MPVVGPPQRLAAAEAANWSPAAGRTVDSAAVEADRNRADTCAQSCCYPVAGSLRKFQDRSRQFLHSAADPAAVKKCKRLSAQR